MPHPFHWVPAEGERHASTDVRPPGGYPTGTNVTTLCGQCLTAEDGVLPWLWTTCSSCNATARRMAGAA